MEKKKLKKTFIEYVMMCLCLIHLFIIEIINFIKSYQFLDYDSGLAIRHAIDMWRNGTIFLNDFVYTTSMEIDCPGFFAAPIYLLTNNLGVAMGLVHIFFDGLLALGIFLLLRNLKVENRWRYAAILLVMTLWDFGQLSWDNMLFFSDGQYEFRVLAVIFSLVNLTYSNEESIKGIERIAVSILSCFFTFWVSLSMGNYLLMVFAAPIILAVSLWCLEDDKLYLHQIKWCGLYALSMIIPLVIRFSMGINTNKTNMNMVTTNNLSSNFQAVLIAIFKLFGATTDEVISVISLDGFLKLVKFVFVILLLLIFFLGLFKCKKSGQTNIFTKIIVSMMLVNFLVFSFANTQYVENSFEGRYHILWIIGALLFDIIFLSDSEKKLNDKQAATCWICLICGLLFVNFFAAHNLLTKKSKLDKVRNSISVTAHENGVNSVVFWDDANAPALSAADFNLNVISVKMESESDVARILWGTFEHVPISDRNLFVVASKRVEEVPTDILNNFYFIDKYKGYDIYLTEDYEWE